MTSGDPDSAVDPNPDGRPRSVEVVGGADCHLPPDTTALDLLAEGTLPRAWAVRWADAPGAPVLADAGHAPVDAASFASATARTATRLAGLGLRPGDRVLVSARESLDLAVCHVACLRAGFVVVPVNPAYRARELAHIVTDVGPAAAVLDDPQGVDAQRAAWIRDATDRAEPATAAPIPIVTPALAGCTGEAPVDLDADAPDAPALVAYTSGTTGLAKGAILTHANLLAGAATLTLAWRWGPADRLVLALPLSHLHGLGVGLHGTLLAGASAVLLDGFDVGAVLDAIGAHAATLFFGVPTMYARLVGDPRAPDLGQLRLCVSGSAPLDAALHRRIARVCGQQVLERYGMTETMMLTSNPYEGERRPGTVGLPLPGVDVRLAGPTGGPREVQVRGPSVGGTYWGRPDATAAARTTDGWFRTGDLGELDAAGYLRLVGRASDLVITGGYNVYPREVEDVLGEHPAVAEVAVTGTASPEWGEVVTAHVVAADPDRVPDPDELRAWVGTRLAAYKVPRRVRFVPALPRNALGKVTKHRLG